MSKTNYSVKLTDPRWQRIRLKTMERDGWACFDCGSKMRTLSVHHLYYIKGREPWDYPMGCLITLCEDCHAGKHSPNSVANAFEWENLVAATNFRGARLDALASVIASFMEANNVSGSDGILLLCSTIWADIADKVQPPDQGIS